MRVLLTGANGFVGSHLLAALLQAGHQPSLLLRDTADTRGIDALLPRCRVCLGSLDDAAALEQACDGADAVIHAAGKTRAVRAADFFEVNAAGTLRLVKAANRLPGLRHVVLISSLAASGPGTPGQPARDGDVPRPVSAYGRSKLAAEEVLREHARMPWTILRPPVVYGPRDRELLPLFRWLLAGRRALLPRPGQPLSVIYAGDLAAAAVRCLDRPACHEQIYHVAHPDWTTPGDLAAAIAACAGNARPVIKIPGALLWTLCAVLHTGARLRGRAAMVSLWKWPELRAQGWVCDARRLYGDAGFEPATGLRQGVWDTLAGYQADGWLPSGITIGNG